MVMTTEVLRNMLYAGSPTLSGLGFVVMDEVHYLADRFRGAVWEEVIIHLPESVPLVALSATVSNAEEFGDWLDQVRGDTEVIVDEHRPVPLWQHVMVGHRLYDLFADDDAAHRVNPELVRLAREETWIERKAAAAARPRRTPAAPVPATPTGADVIVAARPRRACCRRSCSSSAGPAATRPCAVPARRAAADHAGRAPR